MANFLTHPSSSAQPGIGTFFNPGVVSPLLEWLAKTADLAVAWYGVDFESPAGEVSQSPIGTSMPTFALGTSSSCRTTGGVTKFVCLVSGALLVRPRPQAGSFTTSHVWKDSPVAPIQLGHWRDFCSRCVVMAKPPSR